MVFEFLFVFAFAMAVNLLIPRHGVKSHALIYHSSPSAVIGAIFALANLFIVNLTGASMIFTRTLTAEIIQNNYTQWWWYFVPHLVAHFIAAVVLYSIPHLEKRRAVKAGLAMLNKRG
jgi:glycerol uptake facilitator-like aquaporin